MRAEELRPLRQALLGDRAGYEQGVASQRMNRFNLHLSHSQSESRNRGIDGLRLYDRERKLAPVDG